MKTEKSVAQAVLRDSDRQLLETYLDACWLEKGLSAHSISAYRHDISAFASWLNASDLLGVDEVAVASYLAVRQAEGFNRRSTARSLSALRGFYRYLVRTNLVAQDPTANVEQVKLGKPLPKSLSEVEVESLLASPDISEAIGLRDKAMLELLYACGLRVTELVSLETHQVNARQAPWSLWVTPVLWPRAVRSVRLP